MPLFRPTELLAFLDELGARPKRALSQNFLIDGNIVEKIVRAAGDVHQAKVVEIGPGPGVLTEAFLKQGAQMFCIEKDTAFAQALPRLATSASQLCVCEADVLECDLSEIVLGDVVLVSNLPYHLTTPIMQWIVRYREKITRAVVMLQNEVAHKLITQAKERSFLQTVLSFFFEVSYVTKVSKRSFFPAPAVDSAVIVLERKDPFIKDRAQQEKLCALVQQGYASCRKALFTSLRQLYGEQQLASAMQSARIEKSARPHELLLHEWTALFNALHD